jgi:hypothetical protein
MNKIKILTLIKMTTVSSMNENFCVSFDPTVGVGALGANVPQTFVRADTWMNLDNNIKSKQDCNSFPIANVASHVPQDGVVLSNWYVNETDRGEVGPTMVEQINLKGDSVWNNLSFLDPQKVTTRQTTEFAYTGNAQRENDGTEFWTYDDTMKTTTRETTEFAYAGNAQRENDGTEFWTYDDTMKTTNKETTHYAYAGNVARGDLATTNYNQYTGYGDGDGKAKSGGADTYALRGATLVENWVSPAGRQNLLGEAEARMGKIDFGTFGSDQNYDGPGTIRQAIPDGAKYQNNYIIGTQRPSPNRLMAVDDRQTAGYLVSQLQQNPLSIYTVNPKADIPAFECDVHPNDFSTMNQRNEQDLKQPNQRYASETSELGYKGMENTVQNLKSIPVYQNLTGTVVNPNAGLVYNEQTLDANNVNQFLVQKSEVTTQPSFSGKCYSGDVNFGWDSKGIADQQNRITIGGKDEPGDYGNLYSSVNIPSGMAQGINNPRLQTRQSGLKTADTCEGNRALNFATNTLVLESVGGN